MNTEDVTSVLRVTTDDGDGGRDVGLPGNVWQTGKCCQDRSPTPPPPAGCQHQTTRSPESLMESSFTTDRIPEEASDLSMAAKCVKCQFKHL